MGTISTNHFKMKSGDSYIIRHAVPTDAEQLIRYVKGIVKYDPYVLTTEQEFTITVDEQKKRIQSILADSNQLCIVAVSEEAVIGTLDFMNGQRKRIEHQGSFGMSVQRDFRGSGVGRELLNGLLTWAKLNITIEKVCLEVFSLNQSAIKLYESNGFKVEGKREKQVKLDEGGYDDLVQMAIFV